MLAAGNWKSSKRRRVDGLFDGGGVLCSFKVKQIPLINNLVII